jgi:hypothetical protein
MWQAVQQAFSFFWVTGPDDGPATGAASGSSRQGAAPAAASQQLAVAGASAVVSVAGSDGPCCLQPVKLWGVVVHFS